MSDPTLDPATFHRPVLREQFRPPQPGQPGALVSHPSEEELRLHDDIAEPPGLAPTEPPQPLEVPLSVDAEVHGLEAMAAAADMALKGTGSMGKQAHLVNIAQAWFTLSLARATREAGESSGEVTAWRVDGRTGRAEPIGIGRG